jgi:hypothetical protein
MCAWAGPVMMPPLPSPLLPRRRGSSAAAMVMVSRGARPTPRGGEALLGPLTFHRFELPCQMVHRG